MEMTGQAVSQGMSAALAEMSTGKTHLVQLSSYSRGLRGYLT